MEILVKVSKVSEILDFNFKNMTTIIIEENVVLPKTQFKTINDMQNFMVFFLKNNNKITKQKRLFIKNFEEFWKKKTISDFIWIWKNFSDKKDLKSSFDKFLWLWKWKVPNLSDKELINESIKNKYIIK